MLADDDELVNMKMGECFALVEKEEAETILEELLEKATAKVS